MFAKKDIALIIISITLSVANLHSQPLSDYQKLEKDSNVLVFQTVSGQSVKFSAFSNYLIRIQAVQQGEEFFPDDHYEMVADYSKKGSFSISDKGSFFEIYTNRVDGLLIKVYKQPLGFEVYARQTSNLLVKSKGGIVWESNRIRVRMDPDTTEHFCGLGHQAYGLVESIDLKGKTVSCNYGDGPSYVGAKQAVLSAPFYISSKGYGIFLNSTFPHKFIFGQNKQYEFGIDTKGFEGRMDFFFILGPGFKNIINRYTELTGRPRLPQRSIFGLQLSDKGDPDNNGEEWWKNKITQHRNAGFPFDHIVNDNRWRAGTGAWSGSWFEWDPVRYPDPKEYAQWCKQNHVTLTLDLNRNNAAASWGWKPEYNLPGAIRYVKEGYSAPDYSNPEVRKWVWELFWTKSFNPALAFPGDALWIDETDEMNTLPDSIICANGRSWAENRNYYHFLIAKAVVQEGWDNQGNIPNTGIGENKRPFVWMRGMTAGAQRYATYWSGDIKCDYGWMKKLIRGMQTAGIAGLPYFNHDAGGFRSPGPNDSMYIQWSMAFGSFTPIWRPHGSGINKRWPLDRSDPCQKAALIYGKLRYEMMPYIYTFAHEASVDGMPMARAMVLDYQHHEKAWTYDLQYMWGSDLLVAPVTCGHDTSLSIWLPPDHNWYSLWNDRKYEGNQVLQYDARVGELPVFVKEGAIIPKYTFALSTFLLDAAELTLDVYAGKDGEFALYEDDAITERYKTKNEYRITNLIYNESDKEIIIKAAIGNYTNSPETRSYKIIVHGLLQPYHVECNGKIINQTSGEASGTKEETSTVWMESSKLLQINIEKQSVHTDIKIKLTR